MSRREALTQIRERLQSRKDALERPKADFDQPATAVTDVTGDLFERATRQRIENEEGPVDAVVQRELDEVQAALQRMEDGKYGFCDDCSKPISLPRLQAKPTAATCIRCQREIEKTSDQVRTAFAD